MSDKEGTNKGTANNAAGQGGDGKETINVVLDHSQMEKDLQNKLDVEKKEKTDLNNKITEQEKALVEMKKASEDKTAKFTELEVEAKKSKDKLAEIAMKEFNRRKDIYVETMKKAGLPDEKINEVSEKVKTPKDLDDAEIYLTVIPEMMRKADADRQKAAEDAAAAEVKKKADEEAAKKAGINVKTGDTQKGGGVTKLGENKSKDMTYTDYREGVDDLYKRRAKGDKTADAAIKGLWDLGIKKLKTWKDDFGIQECLRCGAGIKQGEVCPYCGFDPATYIKSSKEE